MVSDNYAHRTLEVKGNFVQAATATTHVTLWNDQEWGLLDVLGSATIAGSISFDERDTIPSGTSHQVAKTGTGIFGTFNPIAGWSLNYLGRELAATKS